MKKDKSIKFDNCNLYFCGTKMDTNGNGVYLFQYPNGRVFSIQNHNFWQGSYFRIVKEPKDLFIKSSITPEELEAQAIGYISVFGSKKQKERLRIYKSFNR